MNVSVFDIFKIGVGPSSSHTMGPMNAAHDFMARLLKSPHLTEVRSLKVFLYGSLALTGKGHCTDKAILLGLSGSTPESLDPDRVEDQLAVIRRDRMIPTSLGLSFSFVESEDLIWLKTETLPFHPNGMICRAFDQKGTTLLEQDYYSIGGGFIVTGKEPPSLTVDGAEKSEPYPFHSAKDLLDQCVSHNLRMDELVFQNELTRHDASYIKARIKKIAEVMDATIDRGLKIEGILPGSLKVPRRAPGLFKKLSTEPESPMQAMDWVSLYAMAVNEENAAGGRVVTAPTNGAAGIIPAVLRYYKRFERTQTTDGVERFLLTAAAIAMLYKENASLSGAELGCQGEVGVACSMAAGGLVSALLGNNQQIENAAEIGMEHNLGLTCDPVGGLVQIPCIERNTMGALKAINAARLAMHGDGSHKVSLDQVIATMAHTGRDMSVIYKETSQGGLAVNVPEC